MNKTHTNLATRAFTVAITAIALTLFLPPRPMEAQPVDPPAAQPATQPATQPAPTDTHAVLTEAPATQPATQATTQPATQPATQPTVISIPAASRPVTNGPRGITTQPGGSLLINFQDASIDSVLDELSTAAGFIVIKEVKPEGRVSLSSKGKPVRPDEAIPLLNSVLKNAGYAAIQQERILKIVPRDKAKRANIPVRNGANPLEISNTDELITQVIPLKYTDAMQLKNDLAPLVSPEADFTANASSNSIVMTDTSANIRRLVEIIKALDTNLADSAEVKVFMLKYANATAAAKLVTDVFQDQTQQGGRGGFSPFGMRGMFGGGGGFPGGGGGGGRGGGAGASDVSAGRRVPRVTASADDRTNTLVVSGPAELLKVIERVIKELDENPAAEETVFIYRLKNATAINVESVMNSMFNLQGGGTRTGTQNRSTGSNNLNRTGTNRNTSGRSSSGRSSSGGLTSGRSTGSSSFGGASGRTGTFGGTTGGFGGMGGFSSGGFRGGVSSGAQRTAADLMNQVSVIADIDTNSLLVRTHPSNVDRVKMVLDELDRPLPQVLIKVLIAEVTHDNGADIGAEFSILNVRTSGNGQKYSTNFNVAKQSGGLVMSLLETDVTATIRALETVGKLDVLSRPYILASDNQLASITVGQEVPFITNSRITDTGQTINTIEYDDIGILLDVIPHINPDGLVILDVAPEISALTGTTVPVSETVSAPVIAKRSAQSRVAIQNGQTVVIGGLMEDRMTQTIDKVPLLGDIPLLGELFKRKQNKKSKTELLIFLTPHVAQRPDSLKEMGKQELEGSKLVPNAVDKGMFQEHQKGMDRGHVNEPQYIAPATRRTEEPKP